MEPMDVAQSYFDAWNRRDPAAIVATFAEGGTYSDPTAAHGLMGPAIADYARGLFTAFPDLSFEIVSAAPVSDGVVAAQWLMRGANTGPFGGGPPTGCSVALPGADFITVKGDKIRSVQAYFDQRTLVEQLGLQVIVQPYSIGPYTWGSCTRRPSGKLTRPGAFSLTWIQVRSEEEANEVRERSRKIVEEMAQMPGFISWLGIVVGNRLHAVTAWEDKETAKRMAYSGAHKEAIDRFFGPDFADAVHTSVWVPDHFNPMWVRCAICGVVADYDRLQWLGKCQCGEALPEPPPYW